MIPNRYEVGFRVLAYVETRKAAPPWSRWRAYSQGDLVTDRQGLVWAAQRAVGPLATAPAAGADWAQPATLLVQGDHAPTLTITAPDGTATTYQVGDLNSKITRLENGAYLVTVDLTTTGTWTYTVAATGTVAYSATRRIEAYARGAA